ncbi:hypothetical protein [Microtetraspora glauca]|uniref:Uncharacterized protein n=1 Tax=Microtetraspora glauca TaxID=1996 RepID=A0ABV3GHD0_MICGL
MKGAQIDAWYAGKTSDFGGNVQALFAPDGFPLWTSDVEPGGVPDIDAARTHVLPLRPNHADPRDPGYQCSLGV